MSKLIESLILEVRPRLQTCNIFIVSHYHFGTSSALKINIKPQSIDLMFSNNGEQIKESVTISNFSLLPRSISSFIVEGKHVSLRVSTKPLSKTHGSFQAEVLNLNTNSSKRQVNAQPMIEANSPIFLCCKNCTNSLTAVVNFERILPLPSENCNPGDWFCHKPPSTTNGHLEPKYNDCFYGFCNFTINEDILDKSALHLDRVIHCQRCLAWLGTNNQNRIQFWNCTVSAQAAHRSDDCASKRTLDNYHSNSNPSSTDFRKSILNLIDETVGFVCKILVECDVTNLKTEYVLLWVVDKKLEVHLFEDQLNGSNSVQGRVLVLDSRCAVKLLYQHLPNYTNVVRTWESDVHVQNLKIAYPMLKEGLIYLNSKTKLMPTQTHTADGFTISYILLD